METRTVAAVAKSYVAPGDFVPSKGDLIAGRSIKVGTVTATNNAHNLCVTYTIIAEGWVLSESHLAVALTADGIPQTKKGNPIPSQFAYKTQHNPTVTECTYTIPLEDAGWVAGDTLCLAAHAEVQRVDAAGTVLQAEGAWAAGEEGQEFQGKNWATYFEYASVAQDSWSATSTIGAPSPRTSHTAVWTGTEMIVWGGVDASSPKTNTGGRYDPASNSWRATSTVNAPSPRNSHSAVWTGTEMIIWGGVDGPGARYNPATDTWTAMSTTGAPSGRRSNAASWTETEMIIWGGYDDAGHMLDTGGRYNPASDTWTSMSTIGAPSRRYVFTWVWTGTEIIWGGRLPTSTSYFNTGGRYSPESDTWTSTTTIDAPSGRISHTAVWTGNEMIIWGGSDSAFGPNAVNTGSRYDPSIDTWTTTSTIDAPVARQSHSAVWTGTDMIVWGGLDPSGLFLGTGGRYDPISDTWTPTSTIGAPLGRFHHTAVWTGTEMIVWGGYDQDFDFTNTGGRYW